MSRVGAELIRIPEVIKIERTGQKLSFQNKEIQENYIVPESLDFSWEKGNLQFFIKPEFAKNKGKTKSLLGTTRSIVNNIVVGLTQGYEKTLLINGVGYKAEENGKYLHLSLGFSHDIKYKIPLGITVKCIKPIEVLIKGLNKQLLGSVAAYICAIRKFNPYGGTGITIKGNYVRRKEATKK